MKKRFINLFLGVLGGVVLVIGQSHAGAAQETEDTKGKSVKQAEDKILVKAQKLDVNQNGVLDREEIDAKKAKLGILAGFAEKVADQNKDGIITIKEYADVQIDEIRKSDKNKDGFIDDGEEKERKKELFKMVFRN